MTASHFSVSVFRGAAWRGRRLSERAFSCERWILAARYQDAGNARLTAPIEFISIGKHW